MGAPHASSDFWAAIDPVANREYYGLENEWESQFDKIFDVSSDDEPIKSSVEYGGPAVLDVKQENAPVAGKRITQGQVRQWNAVTYAASTTISIEAAEDVRNRYSKIAQAAGTLGRATKVTPEVVCALVLDRAFDSSYPQVGSKELCSTSHVIPDGSATFANMLSVAAALDEASLEDVRTALRTIIGPDGNIMPHKIKGIVVPAALDPIARKLSISEKTVGSANNDPSIVKGTKVLNFDYLGSSTRWGVVTDNKRGLFWDWIKKPQFLSDSVPLNLQRIYAAWFRARVGIVDPRGYFGSNAS